MRRDSSTLKDGASSRKRVVNINPDGQKLAESLSLSPGPRDFLI